MKSRRTVKRPQFRQTLNLIWYTEGLDELERGALERETIKTVNSGRRSLALIVKFKESISKALPSLTRGKYIPVELYKSQGY